MISSEKMLNHYLNYDDFPGYDSLGRIETGSVLMRWNSSEFE
jgi:hypothetical protein